MIILGYLFCTDYFITGHDICRLPGRKPIQEYPFQRFRDYLEKIKGRKISKITSYYRLKNLDVLREKKQRVKVDFNSTWWQDYFNLKFRFFVAPQKWDNFWTIVVFDIPENQRQTRDTLRKYLKHLGFVQWQRSVWVTINDVTDYLSQLIGADQVNLFCFQARSLFRGSDKKIIRELFKPRELEDRYKKFIAKAELALKGHNYKQAKKLIVEFPEIILEDRGVPGEFFKNSKIRQNLYKKTKKLNQLINNHAT